MGARKRAPAKKAPGRNVEDWERPTERVTLRLPREVHTLLLSLATEIGEGDPKNQLSRTVEEALRALSREMGREVNDNEDVGRGAGPRI